MAHHIEEDMGPYVMSVADGSTLYWVMKLEINMSQTTKVERIVNTSTKSDFDAKIWSNLG